MSLPSYIDRPFGVPPNKRPSKYRAIKTEVDGIIFDSKREAKRWQELKLLEKGKYIRNLERQVPFRCVVNGKLITTYKADFIYFEGAERVAEDAKGFRTREYILKRKLVEALFNVKIREV